MKPPAFDQGIEPVPVSLRRLGPLDNFVLWASLSVGLLVLVTGSFLVPALGVGAAFAAIAVGSALGGLILGLVAWLAAGLNVPGMVLLRGALGVRGSFAPTLLNVVQNVGWAVFEVIVIAHAARAAAGGSLRLWTVVATAVVVALAVGGPLVVVRRVLRVVGVPVIVVAGLYTSYWAATRLQWHAAAQGKGGLTFWLGVDLAIAIPISWAPLVADYARFSKTPAGALIGTATGAALANAWFYGLGAALALVGAADPDIGISSVLGAFVLGLFALAESDKPFADLYSTVVSIQNVRPRWSAPALAVVVGAAVGVIALTVDLTDYESFLFLLGSFFVPLAGVLLGHALRLRGYDVGQLYALRGRYGTVNPWSAFAWLAGFALYQWIAPTQFAAWSTFLRWAEGGLGIATPPSWVAQFGASIPSFLLAAVLAFATARLRSFGACRRAELAPAA